MDKYRVLQQRTLLNTYADRGITIDKGQGVYLFDTNGKKYLDMMSNYGVNILGYQNELLNAALKEQIDTLINLHCGFNNDKRALASQLLLKKLPVNLKRIYWSSSGAETIEAALKFAIYATSRNKVLVLKNGYHGKTLGALSLTTSSEQKYQKGFSKILIQVDQIEINNKKELAKVTDEYAAVFIEVVQGEGGIHAIKEDFLMELRKTCTQNGVLLIIDEVQTGLGRTGKFIALQHYTCEADILCLGKGIAGGIPCGATVVNDAVATSIPKGMHTSTMGGNPLAMAGVMATLEQITDEVCTAVHENGEYFLKGLKRIHTEKINQVRGVGLMVGISLRIDPTEVIKALQKNGILAAPAGSEVIRFLPPLFVEKEHIDFVLENLRKILES